MSHEADIPRENWFSQQEYQRRLDAVRKEMAQRELDALLLFSPANVYYLTGHHSIDSWEFRAVVVTHDRDPALLLYRFERGRFEASSWLSDAVYFGPQDDPIACLANLVGELAPKVGRLGIEWNAANLNVAACRSIEKKLSFTTLLGTDCLVDRIRLVKSSEELACVRRAAEFTNIGMRAAVNAIRENVTDGELVAASAEAMFRAGSHLLVMQPTVAIGYRSGLSHSQHDGVAARRGDSIFIELSGNWRHYSAPLMVTSTLGSVNDERQEFLEVAHQVAETILEHARPGIRACDVAAKALETLRPIEDRIEFHYVFGYSVGISFPPHWLEASNFYLRATNTKRLQAGMVFHLPLTMRKLGQYGAGTSRTIVVTESGAEVLTGDPQSLPT